MDNFEEYVKIQDVGRWENQHKTLRLIDYELININIKEDDAIVREEMENKHWNKEKNMLYRRRKESEIRWILLPSPFC